MFCLEYILIPTVVRVSPIETLTQVDNKLVCRKVLTLGYSLVKQTEYSGASGQGPTVSCETVVNLLKYSENVKERVGSRVFIFSNMHISLLSLRL